MNRTSLTFLLVLSLAAGVGCANANTTLRFSSSRLKLTAIFGAAACSGGAAAPGAGSGCGGVAAATAGGDAGSPGIVASPALAMAAQEAFRLCGIVLVERSLGANNGQVQELHDGIGHDQRGVVTEAAADGIELRVRIE